MKLWKYVYLTSTYLIIAETAQEAFEKLSDRAKDNPDVQYELENIKQINSEIIWTRNSVYELL